MAFALDVPLYPCELAVGPSKVCVTGATGFIASVVTARLLAAGHTVHGTVRDVNNGELLGPLKALPGASERLVLFKASLLEERSFDDAIAGCDFVIHLASPFVLTIPKGKTAREVILDPAVKGVENVLGSVNRTPSVKRVVLTSSVAAVYGDPGERGKDHVLTEQDWNISSKEDVDPYSLSKTLAEKKAFEIFEQQSRWELVTILPSMVFGPPVGSRGDGESVKLVKSLTQGSMWPGCAKAGFGCVDIRDVAAAHCVAMSHEKAKGRYIVSNDSYYLLDMAHMINKSFPGKFWLPWTYAPFWLVLLMAPLLGVSQATIKSIWDKCPKLDHTRAATELGLAFLPMEQSLRDMLLRMLELKMIK